MSEGGRPLPVELSLGDSGGETFTARPKADVTCGNPGPVGGQHPPHVPTRAAQSPLVGHKRLRVGVPGRNVGPIKSIEQTAVGG